VRSSLAILTCILCNGLFAAITVPAAVEHSGPLSADVEPGRLIYEQGILPDGGKLTGVNPQGFVLKGREAACAARHRRSGYGGFEGNVMVPPITTSVLSIPGPHFIKAGPTPDWSGGHRPLVPRDDAPGLRRLDPGPCHTRRAGLPTAMP
jgi:hypothetical protein